MGANSLQYRIYTILTCTFLPTKNEPRYCLLITIECKTIFVVFRKASQYRGHMQRHTITKWQHPSQQNAFCCKLMLVSLFYGRRPPDCTTFVLSWMQMVVCQSFYKAHIKRRHSAQWRYPHHFECLKPATMLHGYCSLWSMPVAAMQSKIMRIKLTTDISQSTIESAHMGTGIM